ncbi:hypothetical protein ACFL0H_12680 [Thermodesulfobacteriota bacterium]
MQDVEERRLKRMSNTPHACREPLGPELTAEGLADKSCRMADDALMVNQG